MLILLLASVAALVVDQQESKLWWEDKVQSMAEHQQTNKVWTDEKKRDANPEILKAPVSVSQVQLSKVLSADDFDEKPKAKEQVPLQKEIESEIHSTDMQRVPESADRTLAKQSQSIDYDRPQSGSHVDQMDFYDAYRSESKPHQIERED